MDVAMVAISGMRVSGTLCKAKLKAKDQERIMSSSC